MGAGDTQQLKAAVERVQLKTLTVRLITAPGVAFSFAVLLIKNDWESEIR